MSEPDLSGPLPRARLNALVARAKPLLPWGSLGVGLLGALLMDRSPKSAWLIVLTAFVGWGAVGLFAIVGKLDPDDYSGRKKTVVKLGGVASLLVTQSLMQTCLMFALPFYVQAATWSLLQWLFLALLVAITAVTLWDPLYERLVKGHALGFVFHGFAVFCALNAALPPMGLSNSVGLIVSGMAAAAGVPLHAWVTLPKGQRKPTLIAGAVVGVGFPLLLAFGGAPFIPPAPLKLSAGAIGVEIKKKWVAEEVEEVRGRPAVLYCATAVAAPRGLKDRLFHVWHHDGRFIDRVELSISGGRKAGFRTWSKKTRMGKKPWGEWTCTVETRAGQVLGRRSVDVLEPEPAPEPAAP
jgi:hypothetical protein